MTRSLGIPEVTRNNEQLIETNIPGSSILRGVSMQRHPCGFKHHLLDDAGKRQKQVR